MQTNGGIPAVVANKAASKAKAGLPTVQNEPKGKRVKWTPEQKELMAQQVRNARACLLLVASCDPEVTAA